MVYSARDMSKKDQIIPSASVISKEAGLMIFGAAAGLLISGVVGSHARKPLGFILGAAGIAAAGPEIAKLVDRAINSPSTPRGSKKTLEGIRYSAGKPIESADFIEEDLYIG